MIQSNQYNQYISDGLRLLSNDVGHSNPTLVLEDLLGMSIGQSFFLKFFSIRGHTLVQQVFSIRGHTFFQPKATQIAMP